MALQCAMLILGLVAQVPVANRQASHADRDLAQAFSFLVLGAVALTLGPADPLVRQDRAGHGNGSWGRLPLGRFLEMFDSLIVTIMSKAYTELTARESNAAQPEEQPCPQVNTGERM